MDIGYVWEKFHLAIRTLAGPGDLPSRLCDTYLSHLHGFEPDRDLPGEIHDDYRAVKAALTRVQAKGSEGNAMASARALGELEARDIAGRIVSMYEEVARLNILEEAKEDRGDPAKPSDN